MADLTEQQLMMQDPEVLGLQRQRQLANLLTGQAFNAPQGQMISGRYVKPSGLQQALPMINAAIGGLTNANLDTKQTELAAALRGRNAAEIQEYARLQQTDPAKAIQYGLNSQNPTLKAIVAEDLKTQKYGEGEIGKRMNLSTGLMETIGQGNPKYRAPLHYDLGNYISVRDPNDPTKETQRLPKGVSPEAAARLADEGIGGYGGGNMPQVLRGQPVAPTQTINHGSPILAKPNAAMQGTMPAAGVNILEDFNKSIVPPAGLPPKDQRKWNAEANSPLTGEAAKQVTGAINTIGAIDEYRSLVAEAARTGIVSPEQRAKLESARNTMNLLGKEAYNLGVLNGPDLSIMNSLTVDFNNPKSLLLSKQALDNLIEKQRNVMNTTVQNVYGTQQKKIPAYVIDKLKPAKTEITAAQAGNIQRPSMIDETTWGFMTPQEKALFRKQ